MQKKITKNQIYFIQIALLVLLLPLIVRFGIYETGISNEPWNTVDEYATDLYLYNKSRFFIILSSIMLVFMFADWKRVKETLLRQKVIWGLLGCYSVFVIISALTSQYPLFATQGGGGQFESVFVLLGYVITALYCTVYCQEEAIYKKLPLLFLISSLVLGILGCLQISGNDPFYTKFVQSLCIPADVLEASGGIQFRFENNRVYLTLYNSNYAGVYCTCMIVILLSMVLSEKTWKKKILYAIALPGMIISLIGSGSKTGWIITAMMCLFTVLLQGEYFLKKWKVVVPSVVLVCMVFLALLRFAPQGTIQGFADSFLPKKAEYDLEEAYTDKQGIHFLYHDVEFCVSMEWSEQGLTVGTTCNDAYPMEIVQVTDGTAHFLLRHEALPDIPVSFVNYNNIICMQVQVDGKNWIVTDQLANVYLYLNTAGNFDVLSAPETAVFTEYPSWLTYRGYIWARTLPLLKDNFFLGSGPDSFVMVYPNNDYLGRHHTMTENEYTSRPHNWYLQVGVQTGIPSMLCLIAALLIYCVKGFKSCFRKSKLDCEKCKWKAFLLGTIAFILMAFINDSSICITPLFWVMFGMVMAKDNKLSC